MPSELTQGIVFYRADDPDNHPHVVVSDSQKFPSEILTVNFSSSFFRGCDETVVMDRGECCCLTRRSFVFYAKADLMTLEEIESMIASGEMGLRTTRHPSGKELSEYVYGKSLQIIQEGFGRSKHAIRFHKKIAAKQNFFANLPEPPKI